MFSKTRDELIEKWFYMAKYKTIWREPFMNGRLRRPIKTPFLWKYLMSRNEWDIELPQNNPDHMAHRNPTEWGAMRPNDQPYFGFYSSITYLQPLIIDYYSWTKSNTTFSIHFGEYSQKPGIN